MDGADDAVAEQIAYYRERAPEYDDFWLRRGSYALDGDRARQWAQDVRQVEQAIAGFGPAGDVLELACGTGLFTELLVPLARRVTAVDSSPEALALNRQRLPGAAVEYVEADVLSWPMPPGQFDSVVFTYWLSHVPDTALDAFWTRVRAALRPGGRVLLVDSAPLGGVGTAPRGSQAERRRLSDGREFSVVKRYWAPDELRRDLATRGWSADAWLTDHEMVLLCTATPV